MSSPTLEPKILTPRLLLRPPQPSDAPSIARLFQNPLNSQFEPYKPKDPTTQKYECRITEWQSARIRNESCFMIVVKLKSHSSANGSCSAATEGEVIGFGGINAIFMKDEARTADVVVVIDSREWRKGYGREALKRVLGYVFGEADCESVVMETMEVNKPFQALVETMGLGGLRKVSSDGTECEYQFGRGEWMKAQSAD